jgi:hypothetical protein
MFKKKPTSTFVLHVIDEIMQGRYLRSRYDPHAFSPVFSPDADQAPSCDWMIEYDGNLARGGSPVRTTWRERHLLRKARNKIMDERYRALKEKRERLRDWP